ncbi:hypothetical protein M413DRAFT_438219 [Hebeloma cylindrosporum]|uniref:Carrier domain-containing protein n=1 Tax=Hebeloma cylindrosporum TaxID=76867 RepID=A0A0C3CYZ4_HEBCY|nr:hypothetical protein M413DRAFT_438219 [Hebeloma cylindrosporum h7]
MAFPTFFYGTRNCLEGYSFTEWPDLSMNRSPSDCTQKTSKYIPPAESCPPYGSSKNSLFLVAIARTIGAYCGTSDVLLAIQTGRDNSTGLLRITWDGERQWDELIHEVDAIFKGKYRHPTSIAAVRESLSLANFQHPCIALCRFDKVNSQIAGGYSTVFSFSHSSSSLELLSSTSAMHSTVSTQILAQVSDLIRYASQHTSAKVSATPDFSFELLSICEKGSDEEVVAAYPHLFPVKFAPDYLTRRSNDMPQEMALRWYPNLSLDSPELSFESMSYLEFHKKSNQIARWLLGLGLEQEGRVAVCLDRNLLFHIIMIGIMRAGGCYVPIDPELPLERKKYIARNSGAQYVLTSSDITSADLFGSATIYIEDGSVQLDIACKGDEDIECMEPDGLAYLLYTSGTTGNPKGCLLTHRGLSQAILALSSTAADVYMNDIKQGCYLAVASIAFDVHWRRPFAQRSQLLESLPTYVNKLGVTHLGIVPSLIEATLNAAKEAEGPMALRYIASGGEKMSDSTLEKWANHPQVRLANFYGPSEVTIGCCARFMTSSTLRANIGRPLANVSAYVVDSEMNIMLRGSVGELVVEGPLVGRGYHGMPDLTKRVFIEWPRKGCWAYRTGDLVRMMPDSTLEIVGRIDTQIKLRGVRIESEGICAIIRKARSPTASFGLDVATLLAKHPVINVEQLVSFFSWEKDIPVSRRKSTRPYISIPPRSLMEQIKAKCEAELASYMRPSHFIPLGWLPLSSNGKTDERLLGQIFRDLDVETITGLSGSHEHKVSRPCTGVEMEVFNVLQEHVALYCDTPHPNMNIFETGLDSMGVIRFSMGLRKKFRATISASEIMKNPRLSAIAAHLVCENPRPQLAPENFAWFANLDLPYNSNDIEQVLPAFSVQEGVLARSAHQDTLYVQHAIISCKEHTSLPKLKLAWTGVVQRHQILRTVFHFGRDLLQIVLGPDSAPINWKHRKGIKCTKETFGTCFREQKALDIAREINLNVSSIPPYRLSVYVVQDHHFLVLSIHHALFDGISLPKFLSELEREYLGLTCSGKVAVTSDILRQISNINFDNAERFWKNQFKGISWPQAVIAPVLPWRVCHHDVPFKASISSLKKLASSHGITLQALLTCAFASILARDIYKQEDVVFGVIRSGRLLAVEHIEDALLPLISVVPMRVNFGQQISLSDIQLSISSTIEYEHVPLGKVQTWIRPGKSLFEILFSISVNESPNSDLWLSVESEPPQADYPLAVEIVLDTRRDAVLLRAAYAGDQDQFLRPCLQDFEAVVHRLAKDPGTYLSRPIHTVLNHVEPFEPEYICVHGDDDADVDSDALAIVRVIVADFLEFSPSLLSPSTSFFSMGLDSIKSVGMAKSLKNAGFPITSTELLRNSTLKNLVKYLELEKPSNQEYSEAEKNFAGLSREVLAEVDKQGVRLGIEDLVRFYPTTALQTGMLSQTVGSQGALYVHAFPVLVSGPIDLIRMQGAWNMAVRAHAILRTTFHFATEAGVWVQAVHSAEILDWAVVGTEAPGDYPKALRQFISTITLEDETSFETPPLWVRLFCPGAGSGASNPSRLVFVMHHALYDGISVGLLLDSVAAFYAGIPQRPVKQFYELLPHFLRQEKEGTSFWLGKLRGFNPTPLKRLHPSSISKTATVEKVVQLNATQLNYVLNRAAVTMQCIGQAACAMLLSKYTGLHDVVFGHTVSGRNVAGTEEVIGPILNTIPCRVRFHKGMRNIELLRSIQQGNLDALPWQQASLRAIQKLVGVGHLWDTLFLFQPLQSAATLSIQGADWRFDDDLANLDSRIQYPLNLEMQHCDFGIILKCASQSSYLEKQDLETVATHLQIFIEQILDDPDGLVFDDCQEFQGAAPRNEAAILPDDSNTISHLAFSNGSFDMSAHETILTTLTGAPASVLKPSTLLAALGIDSIIAIQIVGKYRQAGMKVTASDVIKSRTIGEMLSKITPVGDSLAYERRNLGSTVEGPELAIIEAQFDAAEVEAISRVSSGMNWLIGAWQKSQGTRFQHTFAFQLPVNVDITRLKSAWFSLLGRHPILRSTFACASGHREPRLVTFKTAAAQSWSEEYAAGESSFGSIFAKMKLLVPTPLSTKVAQARALVVSSSHRPYLILHLHHFQYDAWSLQLFAQELTCIYNTIVPAEISNDLHSFLDYYSPNPRHLAEQKKYWQDRFSSSFQPVMFPILNANLRKSHPTRRLIRTSDTCIPHASLCEESARRLGVSLQSIFLACWASVQAKISSSSSSTFGLWHSGRTGPLDNIAALAIPCVNVLPMLVMGLEDSSILEIAKAIQLDLQQRTHVVEQSDQVQVNRWVGAGDQAMCNVFVNVIKVAPALPIPDAILEPVHAPYIVPNDVILEETSINLPITPLIKDDIMIDIAMISKTDSVMMSIDSAAHMMDERQADELMSRWEKEVKMTLGYFANNLAPTF